MPTLVNLTPSMHLSFLSATTVGSTLHHSLMEENFLQPVYSRISDYAVAWQLIVCPLLWLPVLSLGMQ